MTRSPLAYPLNRSADMDVGGAADLQTDIMRFMAILSLCLVAIFALVQSIPLTPAEPVPVEPEPVPTPVVEEIVQPTPPPVLEPVVASKPEAAPAEKAVVLTRPTWQPRYTPKAPVRSEPAVVAATQPEPVPVIEQPAAPEPAAPVEPEKEGFTLRFASDAALTRAVAAHQVGVYAIAADRARRMTVSESRISFWDASTPNTFHEMETTTVPTDVIDALVRTGTATDGISWGVTLPGRMKSQLDSLMQEHRGGSLIIDATGNIHWEAQ